MSKRFPSQPPPPLSAGSMKTSRGKQIIATTLLAGLMAASVVWLCIAPLQHAEDRHSAPATTPDEAGRAPSGEQIGRTAIPPDGTPDMPLQRIRETLGATDKEWQVIEPLVKHVLACQCGLYGAVLAGGSPDAPGQTESIGSMAEANPWAELLRMVLESESASLGEIEYILIALRQERDHARERLRRVLTVRQEAHLVLMGVLD